MGDPICYTVVIGGNAAGKSTVIRHLRTAWPEATVLGEAAAEAMIASGYPNGLAASRDLAAVALMSDAACSRLEAVAAGKLGRIVVEESGALAGIAHLEYDGYAALALRHRDIVCHHFPAIDAHVLFIDTPPEIAWARREADYRKHADALSGAITMDALKGRLEGVYAGIVRLYEGLDCSKVRISNTGSEQELNEKVDRIALPGKRR